MYYVNHLLIINVLTKAINKLAKEIKRFISLNKMGSVVTYLSNDIIIDYNNKEIYIF